MKLPPFIQEYRLKNPLALNLVLAAWACLLLFIILYIIFGHSLVHQIYDGKIPIHALQHALEGKGHHPVEFYIEKADRVVFAFSFLTFFVSFFILFLFSSHPFFSETAHPFNLAVFRIVLFIAILKYSKGLSIEWFSSLPKAMIVPPAGWGKILQVLPINEPLVSVCLVIFKIACVFACVGLFTRASALTVALLGIYVFGIPQFFGKVNHYHHLLWFSFILAAARSGDFFSLDGIVQGWKRADRGILRPPSASKLYGLPLRFCWLVMGVLYSFPGFWKLACPGWTSADNLKFKMFEEWLKMDPAWVPICRIDTNPFLCSLIGIGTIAFELAFILMIIFPALRLVAVFSGIIFHSMIQLFMQISFRSLQTCYVAFFNWRAIGEFIGNRLFPEPLSVLYDGNCKICRRTIATLQVFDILGRINYFNALNRPLLAKEGFQWIDETALVTDMHAVKAKQTWKGYSAYRVIAARIPLLWPLWPFLYLPPVRIIGEKIYRRVADSRLCSIRKPVPPPEETVSTSDGRDVRLIRFTGIALLLINLVYGSLGLTYAWPFACYPTFAGISGPQIQKMSMETFNAQGEQVVLDEKKLSKDFSRSRWIGLFRSILLEKNQKKQKLMLESFWKIMVKKMPELQEIKKIIFYEDTLWVDPALRDQNPAERKVVHEINFD